MGASLFLRDLGYLVNLPDEATTLEILICLLDIILQFFKVGMLLIKGPGEIMEKLRKEKEKKRRKCEEGGKIQKCSY